MPGVIFAAPAGNINAAITALYLDNDDGTGNPCQSSVDPNAWGRVQTTSTVFLTSAAVLVTRSSLSDNGDDDGWADDFETVQMRVEVSNKTGIALTGLTLRASSNDPAIACITRPFVDFGDLDVGESRFSAATFEFTMGEVNRTDAYEELAATIRVSVGGDQFQSALQPQSVTFDLDLEAVGGSGPTTYFESFESGFGTFVEMPLDNPFNPPDDDLGNSLAGVINGDGSRCQYSDPDWNQSVSYGSSHAPICWPNPNNTPDNFWWQVIDDRAFSGKNSLYWGVVLDPSLGFSNPTAQVEAAGTGDPVNLGWQPVCEVDRSILCQSPADCPQIDATPQACVAAQPTLSFKHQVSMLDHRTVNAQHGRGPDRGIVAAQLADNAGNAVGHWIKLVPYVNAYDTQANSNYFGCTFDPTDDGNNEEDFFDPTNPARSHGPSTTCAPEFSFADQGQTGAPFDPTRLGDAADGPGLEGSSGLGTWVEPLVDLGRYRGRRVRIRFLQAGRKLGSVIHYEQIFVFNPDPRDDGWFVDDVRVVDTLSAPATVNVDTNDNTHLPTCGIGCQSVTAIVAAHPPVSAAPGQVVVLDAAASAVPRCIDGVPQYFFGVDVDRDGVFRRDRDVVLRDWTDDATLLVTPFGDTLYVAAVRCGTEPDCADTVVAPVDVECPIGAGGLGSGASFGTPFLGNGPAALRQIRFDGPSRLVWATAGTVDVVAGDLATLRANGGFGGVGEITGCVADNALGAANADVPSSPPPSEAWFYIARSAESCNQKAGGSWGQVDEAVSRDGGINGEALSCGE